MTSGAPPSVEPPAPADAASAPSGPSLLRTALVFGLLGPFIGGIAFSAAFSALASWSSGQLSAAPTMFLFLLIYGVPFSYLMGLPSSIAAGTIAFVWRRWRGPAGVAAACAIGLVVGAASVLAAAWRADAMVAVPLLVACLVATVVCVALSGLGRGAKRAGASSR